MKKILLAAMVCCVAITGVLLSGCDHGNQPEETRLKVLDPYLVWGADYAEVKDHIEAKSWWKDGNTSLEYWESMGWHKWYWVADSLTEQYLFETEEGENLVHVQCYSYYKTLPISEGRKWLEGKGYIFLSTYHDKKAGVNVDFFSSADHATRARLYPRNDNTGRWYIHFDPMPVVN